MYCLYLFSTSSRSMQSAGAASFLIQGILSSSSTHTSLFLGSFWNFLANSSRSNSSCWHGMPMSSDGVRNVYMRPVARSNSKVDVGKNLFNGGQVNSILPLWVVHSTLSLIKVFTCVFAKSGTYQSKKIPPWRWTYSSMITSSFLWISTTGFIVGSHAISPVSWTALWPSWLLSAVRCASFSMHCASIMALV